MFVGPFGAPAWPAACEQAIARAHKTSAADVRVAFTPHSINQLALEPQRRLLDTRSRAAGGTQTALRDVEQPARACAWESDSSAARASVARLPWHHPTSRACDLAATCSSLGVDAHAGERTPCASSHASEAGAHRPSSSRGAPTSACLGCERWLAEVEQLRERCRRLEAQVGALDAARAVPLSAGRTPSVPLWEARPAWSETPTATPQRHARRATRRAAQLASVRCAAA
ncbi:hypothetical protein KFE25_002697 [Diacronema lutheri]|uniref:Uncharacterized protein n=1 Tax=Diacronema lutheri TaxID=2081491 RepID=A0A8J5XN66_DIALT|nr:hypothetical protein KFE25_002697 [Diacronema lutheri]